MISGMDACSATIRERARLYICELPHNHQGDHAEGEFTWPHSSNAHTGVVIF